MNNKRVKKKKMKSHLHNKFLNKICIKYGKIKENI